MGKERLRQRQTRSTAEYMGIQYDSDILPAPVVREESRDEGEGQALDRDGARCYKAVAARSNYLALGRAELPHAVDEACKGMAAPRST